MALNNDKINNIINEILGSNFTRVKSMDEFNKLFDDNHCDEYGHWYDPIVTKITASVIAENPNRTGTKLHTSGKFFTVDVQELIWSQTKSINELMVLDATEDLIVETLVKYCKKILY